MPFYVYGEVARWELGAGGGAIQQPLYPGSDETRTIGTPFPYFIYRSDHYEFTREGFKGSLIGGDNWGLGLSTGIFLPVDEEDSDAREGMDDLDAHFEIGPNFLLSLAKYDHHRFEFHWPIRSSWNMKEVSYGGWISDPKLVLKVSKGAWRATSYLGVSYSNQDYHDRIYSVDAEFATLDRPEYQAKRGVTGVIASFSMNHRGPKHLAGFFISARNYDSAANEDSPLLRRKSNYSAGVVFTWLFARSKEMLQRGDDVEVGVR